MNNSAFIGMVFLLAATSSITACSEQGSATGSAQATQVRPAKIVVARSVGIQAKRVYPGTLVASEQADLAFRVSGELMHLPAKPGMRVKQGELLAQLDGAPYQSTLAAQQARYDLARIQHDQAGTLLKKKIGSQLQFDQAAAELKSAKAALDQARDNLNYTRLNAPFDGVVARVGVENYQTVQAKTPILRLQDNSRLDLQFSVPESLISQLKLIENPHVLDSYCGEVSFSGWPEHRIRACHKEHELVPDPLTRNYVAVFSLDPVEAFALLPGMSATIELDVSPLLARPGGQALMVPVEAVFERDGQRTVWRVDTQMQVQPAVVEVGRLEGALIEIRSGLREGDRVVAAGVSQLRQGMWVKPLTKERGL